MYPWSLFALMGVGVCARTFSLCLAANYSGGTDGYEEPNLTIFGPYFLVPFGLGVAVVAMELGIRAKNHAATTAALILPALFVAISAIGHRPDATYQRFLRLFGEGTGGTPMFVALVAAVAFYAVAAARRVAMAPDALVAAIAAMSLVGAGTVDLERLTSPRALPLLGMSAVALAFATAYRSSWRAVLATSGLALATAIGPVAGWGPFTRGAVGAHVAIAGGLLIGAMFRDELARALRVLCAGALLVAALPPLWGLVIPRPIEVPPAYPLVPILTAMLYGRWVGGPIFLVVAWAGLAGWSMVSGARAYAVLRRSVIGLDQIMLGLLSFALAAGISLLKAGPRFRHTGDASAEAGRSVSESVAEARAVP
jgi:hypothetical protein